MSSAAEFLMTNVAWFRCNNYNYVNSKSATEHSAGSMLRKHPMYPAVAESNNLIVEPN